MNNRRLGVGALAGSARLTASVALCAAIAGPLRAQSANPLQRVLQPDQQSAPAGEPQPQPVTKELVAQRRAAVAQELASARQALESAPADQSGAKPERLQRELALLQRLDLVLAQIDAALDRQASIRASLVETQASLERFRAVGADDPASLNFLALESLRDQLAAAERRADRIDGAVAAARRALEDARRAFDERERQRRQARDALDANGDPARAQVLQTALRQAQLESRIAQRTVELRDVELENERLAQQAHQANLALLRDRRDFIAAQVGFTSDDLEAVHVDLAQRESALAQEIAQAQRNAQFRDSRWSDAKARQEQAPGDADPALNAEVEAQRRWTSVRRRDVELLNRQLERIAQQRQSWQRRYQIANNQADRDAMIAWRREAERALEDLEIERRLAASELASARSDSANLASRVESAPSPQAARWIGEQKRAVDALIAALEKEVASIELTSRLHARLASDVGAETTRFDALDTLESIWQGATRVWNYEIAVVDDRSITPGKIVIGLLLIIGGLWVSRRATRMLGKRLMPRLGVDGGAAAAIQTLIFYALVITFTLFALRIVNVPLTVFTILGGALAIGVGFGSQNIVNNFISGLILLAERPIRVGDLVQIGELFGTVEHIGARSTRVRSATNFEIVVPNSSFLESNVINWTLSDNIVWGNISIGVAYGSDTREVARLLKRAADEHGKVLRNPEPIIYFKDFGDNALVFELWMSTAVRSFRDLRIVQSDLRHRIASLFREAGVTIAFPQRDLHMDTLKPLDIRLLRDDAVERDAAAAAKPPQAAAPSKHAKTRKP